MFEKDEKLKELEDGINKLLNKFARESELEVLNINIDTYKYQKFDSDYSPIGNMMVLGYEVSIDVV